MTKLDKLQQSISKEDLTPATEVAYFTNTHGLIEQIQTFFTDYDFGETIKDFRYWFKAENFELKLVNNTYLKTNIANDDIIFYYQKQGFTTFIKVDKNTHPSVFDVAVKHKKSKQFEKILNE